jgi:hypothetical protein
LVYMGLTSRFSYEALWLAFVSSVNTHGNTHILTQQRVWDTELSRRAMSCVYDRSYLAVVQKIPQSYSRLSTCHIGADVDILPVHYRPVTTFISARLQVEISLYG